MHHLRVKEDWQLVFQLQAADFVCELYVGDDFPFDRISVDINRLVCWQLHLLSELLDERHAFIVYSDRDLALLIKLRAVAEQDFDLSSRVVFIHCLLHIPLVFLQALSDFIEVEPVWTTLSDLHHVPVKSLLFIFLLILLCLQLIDDFLKVPVLSL